MLNSFDDYAAALRSNNEDVNQARFLQYLRNFMIHVQSLDEGSAGGKTGFLSNYEIFEGPLDTQENGIWKDDLSLIAESSLETCRYISENLRTRIVRENVLMPSYRARELGQNGIQWLARRSGRTIREKLAYTHNKLMAVRRFQSIDTGENRLFVAFVKRMLERINQKSKGLSTAEKNFQVWARKFLRSEEADWIGRWENESPNNTLLSDRNYRIIWRQWQQLEGLDDRIREDVREEANHLAVMIFWMLLSELSRYVRFPADLVRYDYDDFSISMVYSRETYAGLVNGSYSGTVTLMRDENRISLTTPASGEPWEITCDEDEVFLQADGKPVLRRCTEAGMCQDFAQSVRRLIIEKEVEKLPAFTHTAEVETKGPVALDIFAVHPTYLLQNGTTGKLSRRVLLQKEAGEEDMPLLPVRDATALYKTAELYSVDSALRSEDSSTLLSGLVGQVRNSIPAREVYIPLQDSYNAFQIEPLRHAIRRYYPDAYLVPESVAAAAEYATGEFAVSDGDCLAVLTLLPSGGVAVTLLQAEYSDELAEAVPETRGISWDRHPTATYESTFSGSFSGQELWHSLGAEGLVDESGKLAFYDENTEVWSLIDDSYLSKLFNRLSNISSDIPKILDQVKQDYHGITSGKKMHVLLISRTLKKGSAFSKMLEQFVNMHLGEEDVLRGLLKLHKEEALVNAAEKRLGKKLPPVWSEHLPALSIEQMFEEFPLITKENHVDPVLGISQDIPVNSTFVLPASGEKEYHFYLRMGNTRSKGNGKPFEARLRHSAFPLKEAVECRLKLTYTYGNDNPYELVFKPVSQNGTVPFRSVRAEWERVKEYPYLDLPCPKFPTDLSTWESLRHVKAFNKATGQNIERDAIGWIEDWADQCFSVPQLILKKEFFTNPDSYDFVYKDNLYLFSKAIKQRIESNRYRNESYVSCVLAPEKGRYTGELSNSNWHTLRKTGVKVAFLNDFSINNTLVTVAFFKNNYVFESDQAIETGWFSFGLHQKKNGKWVATYILPQERNTKVYRIKYCIPGSRHFTASRNVFYPFHKIYNANRSVQTPGCPDDFRKTVEHLVIRLVPAFKEAESYEDRDSMYIFFRVICVMAREFDSSIYEFILQVMKDFPKFINRDIGCALGKLTRPEEYMLLDAVTHLGNGLWADLDSLKILNMAAWKNETFLENLYEHSPDIVLDYYMKAISFAETAVKKITIYKDKNPKSVQKNVKRALYAFEYILATFRLREWGTDEVKRRLSLNDDNTAKIPGIIDDFLGTGVSLPHSHLQFSLSQKTGYDKVPDLLYAIMFYLRGGGDEITIASVSDDDDDE